MIFVNFQNNTDFNGSALNIVKLIHGKTKQNTKNNLYVKNFPLSFTENDLKDIFGKFGEIKSIFITRDEKSESKGFGFICYSNPGSANLAFREINDSNIQYNGLPPLYVNYSMKKTERQEIIYKNNLSFENCTLYAKYVGTDVFTDEAEFEKELRLFIKLIMVSEYVPKELTLKFTSLASLVTMQNSNDMATFMNRYTSYSTTSRVKFMFNYYRNKNIRDMDKYIKNQYESLVDPMKMFNNFANLSVVGNFFLYYYYYLKY